MSPVFRHGRLRLYLLKLLDEAPRHGYEIIRLLQDRFLGVYAPSPGTIYPRLARLEEEGLVTHDEADGRKVYRITEKGREELRARFDDLAELEDSITASVRDIAREVTEDVRETVRSLREELASAVRDVHTGPQPGTSRGSGRGRNRRTGGEERGGAGQEWHDAAQQPHHPDQGRQGDGRERHDADRKPRGAEQERREAARERSDAEREAAQERSDAEREAAQTRLVAEREAAQARFDAEWDAAQARLDAEQERLDAEQGDAHPHGGQREHRSAGHGRAPQGGQGRGRRRGHEGRAGSEWGDWSGWAGWSGHAGWPKQGGSADPRAYRDLERLAKQFTKDLRSVAWQAQAMSEDAVLELRQILDEAIGRIKAEVFGGHAAAHDPPHGGEHGPAAGHRHDPDGAAPAGGHGPDHGTAADHGHGPDHGTGGEA